MSCFLTEAFLGHFLLLGQIDFLRNTEYFHFPTHQYTTAAFDHLIKDDNMITTSPFLSFYPFSIVQFDNAVVKLNSFTFSPSTTLTDRVPLFSYPVLVK